MDEGSGDLLVLLSFSGRFPALLSRERLQDNSMVAPGSPLLNAMKRQGLTRHRGFTYRSYLAYGLQASHFSAA